MRKVFFILILLFITMSFFGSEIIDFKFKQSGPLEERIYLMDNDKKMDNGYFSITRLLTYSDDNYIIGNSAFFTYSVDNKLSENYQEKIDTKDILNLSVLKTKISASLALMIISGSIGLTGLITGAAICGTAYSLRQEYDGETIINFSLLLPGIIVTAAGGAFTLLATALFLPIYLYSRWQYKNLKTELLDLINNGPLSFENENFRFKFALNFDFTNVIN